MHLFVKRHPEAKEILLPAFLARHKSLAGYGPSWYLSHLSQMLHSNFSLQAGLVVQHRDQRSAAASLTALIFTLLKHT